MKILKRSISLILILVLLSSFTVYADEDLEEQKKQVQYEISFLQAQLDVIFANMTEIEAQMAETEKMLTIAEESLAETKELEKKQYEALKKRIKYFYEQGENNLIIGFFESRSIADIFKRMEYVKDINEYDRMVLDIYIQTKEDIETLSMQLEEEQAFLTEEQAAYAEEQNNLNELIADKREEIENIDELIAEAERKAREEAERKKAEEEEAKRRAIAEAEKKRAIEEAKQQSSGDNASEEGSGSGTSDPGTSGTENPSPQEQGGNETPAQPTDPVKDTSSLWYCTLGKGDIYIYLINSGMTAEGAAGMLGNLYAESGLRSANLENKYNTEFGMTDDEYTAAVDNGTYTKFTSDRGGYGLAQWTTSYRKSALYNYCMSCGASIGNTQAQLQYLIIELKNDYPSLWNVLCSTTDIKEASDLVLTQFERPKNQSDSVKELRYNYAVMLTQ